MHALARALAEPVSIQLYGVLLCAVGLPLAGAAVMLLVCRRRRTAVAQGLQIIAAHNRDAEQWLIVHQDIYADCYQGRRRRWAAPGDVPTTTLPRVDTASGLPDVEREHTGGSAAHTVTADALLDWQFESGTRAAECLQRVS